MITMEPCLFSSDQTLELIPLYSKVAPVDTSLEYSLPSEGADTSSGTEEFDFPSTLVVYSETRALDLANRFRRDADAYYVEAKRSTVSSIAQIPYWMYGVLVVLGWNEAMAVLFNPVYFALVICLMVSS
jgi:protein SEY1